MPKFGKTSLARLSTCHPDLQRLFAEVIKHVDFSVICGHRGQAEQDAAVAAGNSKLAWPKGKHNKTPALAVDVMPCPVNWSGSAANMEHLNYFAGIVRGIAYTMKINVRWGHDWDKDGRPDIKGLVDRPHWELI